MENLEKEIGSASVSAIDRAKNYSMNLLKFILGISLMLVSGISFAQNSVLTGQVVDSLGQAISYANVIAVNQTTQKIGGFGISDSEGRFKLNLSQGSDYILRVSFVGYKPYERVIEMGAAQSVRVVLEQDETMLEMVEVVTELPVTMKGDTLTYKTDAFTTGTERKLKDVLEKLPGFEVDDNGEVKVQGQKVNKLMVDGKDFFDGDTKMGTKNLPANAVDKVQVLKNFNEIAPIRGLDNDESLALNIQLKEGKKNMVFGDLTAGGGPSERYLGHANTFYYAPKLNVNLIADANNIGELAFTLQDYFRFSGGMAGLAGRTGSTVNLSGEDLGIPLAQRNNALDLKTRLAAVNLNYTPVAKWKHAGFVIGSASDNRMGSVSQRTYLNPDGNNQEELSSAVSVENSSALLKYGLTYTPREETYMKYSVFGKVADIHNQNSLNSDFGQLQQQLHTVQTRKPYSVQQKGEWYHAPSPKQVYSVEVNWEKKQQDPFYDLTTNLKPFPAIIPQMDREMYRLWQRQEINTRILEGALNYYRILNPTNHLNWSLGYQDMRQSLIGDLTDPSSPSGMDAFRNDSRFGFQDLYLGMTYKTKWKKLVLSPSLYLHGYSWQDVQFKDALAYRKAMLLPGFYSKWSIKTNKSLVYRFSTQVNFMDVQKLAEGLVVQDYNSVFAGNRMLDNGYFTNHALNYTHHDFFSAFNLFGNLNWQRRRDDLVNTTRFAGVNRLLGVVTLEPINETINGDLTVDKRFSNFKIQGGGRWNAFSTHVILDDLLARNRQFSQHYHMKLTATLAKKLEVDLGYSLENNAYQGANLSNTFTTHSPKLELDWDLWKGFKLNADYTYNTYLNQNMATRSDFEFLNAFVSYQKVSSPWEFRLAVWNILDTRAIRRDSFSENLISTYSYLVQPRYGIVTIKWDI